MTHLGLYSRHILAEPMVLPGKDALDGLNLLTTPGTSRDPWAELEDVWVLFLGQLPTE